MTPDREEDGKGEERGQKILSTWLIYLLTLQSGQTQLDSCSMYQQHGTLRETTQHNLPVARNPAVKPIVTKKLIVSTWDRNATRRAVVNSTGE